MGTLSVYTLPRQPLLKPTGHLGFTSDGTATAESDQTGLNMVLHTESTGAGNISDPRKALQC